MNNDRVNTASTTTSITTPDRNRAFRGSEDLSLRLGTRKTIGNLLTKCMGRRNLARLGRFLTNVARLDIANDLRKNGEHLVQTTVLQHFPRHRALIIFDVGANIGDWSHQLLNFNAGRGELRSVLYAFEPVSSTMGTLARNLPKSNQDWEIVLVQKAVSDKMGPSTISVVTEDCGINAITPDPQQAIKRIEQVELTTIDDYCRFIDIGEIGLVKIDAAGHDLHVLRGARAMLEQKRIHVLQFEYNFRWVWSRMTLFDVFTYARNVDYRVGKVTPSGIEFYEAWDAELEKYVEGNYVFCRPDWVHHFPRISWWKTN